jgi:RNA polymerase sigma-70 factor (ECF subfamily)
VVGPSWHAGPCHQRSGPGDRARRGGKPGTFRRDASAVGFERGYQGCVAREGTVDQHGLVERARRGDRQAFAELIRASGARLDATARLILRDPDLAQDAVQETLIRAWRSLPGLRDPATFDHWLHSLVAHACIDLVRKRRRRVIEVELSPIHDPATRDGVAVIADRDQLDRVLARLEPEARAVVVLHFYLDLSLPRVAEILGIPLGTAKSRLHRSLGAMRSVMAIEEIASAPRSATRGSTT